MGPPTNNSKKDSDNGQQQQQQQKQQVLKTSQSAPTRPSVHYYSSTGDYEKLSNLINNSATPVDTPDPENRTPLHHAAFCGSVSCVAFLLEKKASVAAKDFAGNTPLQWAASKGHIECVRLLVEKDVNGTATVNMKDEKNGTPLHKSSLFASADCVHYLLNKGADAKAVTVNGETPLHYAAAGGNPQCIELLVKADSNVNAVDVDGITPLHQAAFSGNSSCLSLLLRKGAKVDPRDVHGISPLHNAASAGHIDCVDLLVKNGENINCVDIEGVTPLHHACFNGNLPLLKRLIELGAKINMVDEMGETPLHKAAFNGHKDIVDYLLTLDPTMVDCKDIRQSTPLHLAAFNGLYDIVELLVKYRANINIKDEEGATPLHKTAYNGHSSCAKVLIENGAQIQLLDNQGASPLHKAAFNGRSKCLASLIRSGADLEVKDNQGGTALHNAAYNGHSDCCRILLKKGAIVDAVDTHQSTPLHLASAAGARDTVDVLLSFKAKIDPKNCAGKTPLVYATKKAHTDVARVLIKAGADVQLVQSRASIDFTKLFGTNNIDEIYQVVNKRESDSLDMDEVQAALLLEQQKEDAGREQERQRLLLKSGISQFNNKPNKGIEFCIQNQLCQRTPKDIAHFLLTHPELSKQAIGEYIGDGDDFNIQVLHSFVEELDFTGLEIDQALRKFLLNFRLPGEAQKIDRMMEKFAQQFYLHNPDNKTFASNEIVYVLAFSIIMLNTDAHNPNIKKKMTKAEFIKNNGGINNGDDLPIEFMESLYDRIVTNEIQMERDGQSKQHVEKKGWLTKQGGRIKTWKKRWFILTANCLLYYKTPQDEEPCGIIPLENVVVTLVQRKFCFMLHSSQEQMKACKLNSDGTLVQANHASYFISAANLAEMEAWVQAIKSNIHSNPDFEQFHKRKAETIRGRKVVKAPNRKQTISQQQSPVTQLNNTPSNSSLSSTPTNPNVLNNISSNISKPISFSTTLDTSS
ncbi:ankyrin repeat-containing protein [Tieghemostelium lacteum]|uniref:Ankyrin repeat-containing protein n=1 Tax=Tieghemostelium lacteum TaxID=361077 RepID=A0A152A8E5_TIELA|nr:ankyrin repeat-containing protein [Tieghemostelium lacteum]|eukprot:KYR02337.1 ankyrin repeat-containing protein [Tieghemostelium lacteum]